LEAFNEIKKQIYGHHQEEWTKMDPKYRRKKKFQKRTVSADDKAEGDSKKPPAYFSFEGLGKKGLGKKGVESARWNIPKPRNRNLERNRN